MGCALYTIFILLSTVMLLNLLIAIMGAVYEKVEDAQSEEMAELFCKTVEKCVEAAALVGRQSRSI
jgi:hypothetical protein